MGWWPGAGAGLTGEVVQAPPHPIYGLRLQSRVRIQFHSPLSFAPHIQMEKPRMQVSVMETKTQTPWRSG